MKLHLGCGEKFIEGFIHVDLQQFPHIDHLSPVDNLSFSPDNSVDLIYASHVLEHFGRHTFTNTLAEWHRVLKSGGVLRIAVPNFEAVVSRYIQSGSIQELLGLVVGGQKNRYDWHGMIFDKRLLSKTLTDIGFTDVREYNWRSTEHAHIDDYSQAYLPHMRKDIGTLMSLNLEAVKV